MADADRSDPSSRTLRWIFGAQIVGWTVILGLFLYWNLAENQKTLERLARSDARTAIEKDLLYRQWATGHGGVYVPVTASTPPNPYLSHLPERDLVTPSGRRLTLVNPAYMTRQVHTLAAERYGIKGHITSLHPLRPENAPDGWERRALERFERGAPETSERIEIRGEPYLRVMRPLKVEAGCLACHGQQGYRLGDQRGGISVTVPLARYLAVGSRHAHVELLVFGLIWLLGLAALTLGFRSVKRQQQERQVAQAALVTSEAHFRSLYERSPVAYQSLDGEGRILEINTSWSDLLGYSRDEVLGQPVTRYLAPSQAPLLQEHLPRLKVDGRSSGVELTYRHQDGHEVVVSVEGRADTDAQGAFVRSHCMLHDITARKQMENALRQAEQAYRDLFERMIDGFAVHEILCDEDDRPIDYRFLDVNPAFEAMTGLTREAILGRTAREVLPGLEASWIDRYGEVALRGTPAHFENHVAALGRHFAVTAFRNQPRQFATIFVDITARRLAEEKMQEQAALLDVTQDAIALLDIEGRILFTNSGFARLFGPDESQTRGRTVQELWYPAGVPPELNDVRERVVSQGAWTGEIQVGTQAGRQVTVSSRWWLVRDAQQTPRSILVVSTDVTEQRALEAQVMRAQRLESLGVLASGVAHDLNNVLAPIAMAASSLGDFVSDPQGMELLETVERSAAHGASVVRQILTFARGSTGERGQVQPRHVIRITEQLLRETFQKSIAIEVQLDPEMWSLIGDMTQVQQLLMNLCVNARDAMPAGGTLTIDCANTRLPQGLPEALPAVPPGDYVSLSIADTGTGFSDEVQLRMFEPFYTTKPTGQGTGLGLSTALGIVKGHGGGMVVETSQGAGSRFTAYLPAAPAAARPRRVSDTFPSPVRREAVVLIVDDEPYICRMAVLGLQRFGYEVLSAANGQEALEIFGQQAGRISLVVSDYSMPVMDGPTLIAALRALAPDLPIVLASGLAETFSPEQTQGLKVSAVLVKPFTIPDLLQVIEAQLRQPAG